MEVEKKQNTKKKNMIKPKFWNYTLFISFGVSGGVGAEVGWIGKEREPYFYNIQSF